MSSSDTRRSTWFEQARFGLFLHYGLYSVAARHEWVKLNERLTDAEYQRYFDHFTADLFDAREWARTARSAGMRYAVLTSKHHDGFCLWDSALTDYTSARSPAKRDLVAEFVEAFRAEGLRVGLYHSIIDWHHPDYPVDGIHPQWDPARVEELNAGRDPARYQAYLHAQVGELQERFDPDILWFDFAYPGTDLVLDGHPTPIGKGAEFFGSAELVRQIRERNPNVLINDRLDLPDSPDFTTPEETQPTAGPRGAWEACRTLNGSWGYAPTFRDWLDTGQVARLLVDSTSKDGNLLLNLGPTARGELDPQALPILSGVGEWLHRHGDSVYAAGASRVPAPNGTTVTQAGSRVFVHVVGGWPSGQLVLIDLPAPVRFASFLHDGAEVQFELIGDQPPTAAHWVNAGPDGSTVLTLPRIRPDVAVPVIELDLDWSRAPRTSEP